MPTRGHMFEPMPKAWSLERRAGAAVLRIGRRRLPLSDISGVSREEVAERDDLGVLIMGTLFVVMALIFLAGVLEGGWRERFMIGVVFLGFLGMVSLAEAWATPYIRFLRLRIETTSGETLYTTADAGSAAELEALIQAHAG